MHRGTVLCVRYDTQSRTAEKVAPPGKAESGIQGDRQFGVRVVFYNGATVVNSVKASFNTDCNDWQNVSAAAAAHGDHTFVRVELMYDYNGNSIKEPSPRVSSRR